MNTTSKPNRFPLEDMIATAVNNGFAKVQLRTKDYIFKAAPAHGSNPGSIYVTKNNAERTYIGKIKNAYINLVPLYNTHISYNQIREIAENPQEAALRFGQETGSCSICGRPLVAKESVRFAIGPICAEKVGFSFFHAQEDLLDSGVNIGKEL